MSAAPNPPAVCRIGRQVGRTRREWPGHTIHSRLPVVLPRLALDRRTTLRRLPTVEHCQTTTAWSRSCQHSGRRTRCLGSLSWRDGPQPSQGRHTQRRCSTQHDIRGQPPLSCPLSRRDVKVRAVRSGALIRIPVLPRSGSDSDRSAPFANIVQGARRDALVKPTGARHRRHTDDVDPAPATHHPRGHLSNKPLTTGASPVAFTWVPPVVDFGSCVA